MRPTPESRRNFDRLKDLLREMFQLDRGDLDFGLYRIMRMKSDEIEKFLDRDLLPQVRTVIAGVDDEHRATLEKELAQTIRQLYGFGVKPEDSSKVRELEAALAKAKADARAEADAYDHLANFFARYYNEGDFMSLRRYSAGDNPAYLIPYNGEEVKLHWANADQYYVKTTENYASYAFLAGEGAARFRVRFDTAMADNEKDNIKEANGRQRRFVLAKDALALEEDGGLAVRFEHRPLTEQEKRKWPGNGVRQQDQIDVDTAMHILAAAQGLSPGRLSVLAAKAPSTTDPERTLLAMHVGRYTAKNSFDYFIHKDLGGFLRRELDLYLKTDVLDLQDLALGDTDRLRRALGRMRAVREVGDKLIAFLAQLEDFQKRLWLKKKFVLETQWCVTLDRVPEAFYPEIAANEAQWAEWQALFAIDDIAADASADSEAELPGLAKFGPGPSADVPEGTLRSPAFLRAHPHLVLDTRHCDADFTERLLSALSAAGPLDEQTDGLLVHSENCQALNLLRTRYTEQIQCTHIDPPYNTQTSSFMYKNGYRHSSWLAMMQERMDSCIPLLDQQGHFLCHIDENEHERLHLLLEHMGLANAGTIVWDKRNPMTAGGGIAVQHEYVLWRTNSPLPVDFHHGSADLILDKAAALISKHGLSDSARKEFSRWIRSDNRLSNGEKSYSHIDEKGQVYQSVSLRAPEPREDPKFHEPLIHPVTGKPCPVPPNGFSRTPETLGRMMASDEILFGTDETTQPRQKRILHRGTSKQMSSVLADAKKGKSELDALGSVDFPYAHSTSLYGVLTGAATRQNQGMVLDYFAGSGTTGHAVLKLNREDGGRRKYILVEMGEHFDTVMLPRLKKVVHAPNWKNGRPTERDKGVSQLIKYVRLESYEDTLDSLELKPPGDDLFARHDPALVEDYRLRYALDEETADSPCLLGRHFRDPFAYTLSVVRDGERRDAPVDLPETFNLLLGLRVESRRRMDGVLAIAGKDARGRSCLILWRNLDAVDNEMLNQWFAAHRTNLPDAPDLIYANGDHALNAARKENETWKAAAIEPLFRELMFEAENP